MDDILAEPERLDAVLTAYLGAGSPLAALGTDPLPGRQVVLIGMGVAGAVLPIRLAGGRAGRGRLVAATAGGRPDALSPVDSTCE